MKKALLIGINYIGGKYALKGCINDVINMKRLLIDKYDFEEKDILTLTDLTTHKPTKANMVKAFDWLLTGNTAGEFLSNKTTSLPVNSKLFLHYSGHGMQIRSTRDKNEKDKKDEVLCPVDFQTGGFIEDNYIRSSVLAKIPSDSTLTAVIDACHSESVFDLLWSVGADTRNVFSLVKNADYPQTRANITIFSASKDNQTAADIFINSDNAGALTTALLFALEKNDYKIKEDALLFEMKDYIKNILKLPQIPCLSYGKRIEVTRDFKL